MTTKERLTKAFEELAVTQDVDRITVGEISERAGVMRATFYNHFRDKADLIGWGMRQNILYPVREKMRKKDYRGAVERLFRLFLQYKAFFIAISAMEKPFSLEHVLVSNLRAVMYENLEERGISFSEHVWLKPQLICYISAQLLSSIIMTWISRGMETPVEKVCDLIEYLSVHSVQTVLKESRDGTIAGRFS